VTDTFLVGYDGSPGSERALDRAIADAKFRDACLVVAVVLAMPLDPFERSGGLHVSVIPDPDTHALRQKVAENEPPPALQPTVAAARARLRGTEVDGEVVWRAGPPGEEIADLANRRGATKIFLGPHHRRFLDALSDDVAKDLRRLSAPWEIVVSD
jgi:nucleotide-binding universal stress UspA family protein